MNINELNKLIRTCGILCITGIYILKYPEYVKEMIEKASENADKIIPFVIRRQGIPMN